MRVSLHFELERRKKLLPGIIQVSAQVEKNLESPVIYQDCRWCELSWVHNRSQEKQRKRQSSLGQWKKKKKQKIELKD